MLVECPKVTNQRFKPRSICGGGDHDFWGYAAVVGEHDVPDIEAVNAGHDFDHPGSDGGNRPFINSRQAPEC